MKNKTAIRFAFLCAYTLIEPGRHYRAFVDMSGGSSDDAVLAIAHGEGRVAVIDCVEKQSGGAPFNPRNAVGKFAGILKNYGLASVSGDNFAGNTFKADFEAQGISYQACGRPKSDLYETLEPALNAGEVELLDVPTLTEQLVCLVWRGARIDHEPNGHDDFANACAGAVHLVRDRSADVVLCGAIIVTSPWPSFGDAVSTRNPAHGVPPGAQFDDWGMQ